MTRNASVAIIDYGMGNLFSVKRACEVADLNARVTHDPAVIAAADSVILPGVGAFGAAMTTLRELNLIPVIRAAVESGKPFMGICLGFQLLMTRSEEFGSHEGLNLIEGSVVRFNHSIEKRVKVPQVGWNRIVSVTGNSRRWCPAGPSPLDGIPDGTYLYFVHSFYVRPADSAIVLSKTEYGGVEFCSSIQKDNIFACQFHPERSAFEGLAIYRKFAEGVFAQKSKSYR